MMSVLFKFIILAAMLLGLPLLGVSLAGLPLARYLEFPPETQYTSHAHFSWVVFSGYTAFILATTIPFVVHGFRMRKPKTPVARRAAFPWWGWLGAASGVCTWLLAWNRFAWFAPFQMHTFMPLWLAFIIVVNALSHKRRGCCMMLHRTRFFLLLFPVSAAFWWFFEYLNRFVQNWYYTGVDFTSWDYFMRATLPFSTVLPAVLGVREWLSSYEWAENRFRGFFPVTVPHPKTLAAAVLLGSGAGLTGIGVYPDYLFALLWVSPLLIIVSLQTLMGERQIFSDIARGDWRKIVSSALAALFCGWFWEMWNYFSLAKWQYIIPFVDRFHIFEMPVLGYAGYLPFGLECAVIAGMLEQCETHQQMRGWMNPPA